MSWQPRFPPAATHTSCGQEYGALTIFSAAAAGIVRATEVEGLYTADYLGTLFPWFLALSDASALSTSHSWPYHTNNLPEDSVGLILWSAVEMAVTLICIGIPVCRPAYRRFYHYWYPNEQNSGYRKQKYPHDDSSFALQTIGGGTLEAHKGKVTSKSRELSHTSKDRDPEYGISDDGESFSNVKVGGIRTQTRVGRGGRTDVPDNASDEEILGKDYWRSQNQAQSYPGQRGGGGIMVTETVRVDRS